MTENYDQRWKEIKQKHRDNQDFYGLVRETRNSYNQGTISEKEFSKRIKSLTTSKIGREINSILKRFGGD